MTREGASLGRDEAVDKRWRPPEIEWGDSSGNEVRRQEAKK
jgi:hypothetical protein